ncbi:MAG: M48 family metallopeptidase [Pirellulales bacterium]|nr:M48 family metallopeptidase [Pirellulales bacterium]
MSTNDPSTDEIPLAEAAGAAGLNGSELAEAKRYGRLELSCTLIDKAIDAAYLAVAALLLAHPLDNWLQQLSPPLKEIWTLRLTALFLIVTAGHVAVSFGLSFYSGHVLEHKFQLSNQTFGQWLWRYAKRMTLSVALSLCVILGLYWLIWTLGHWWWLAAAGAFFVVSVVLGQLAPVLILPLFYRIEKLDRPELTDRISRLAAGTGLSIAGVYRMDLSAETVRANAMLAGLGRTRRVLLGDTLLDGFQPEEIEVIFAHEIGHHVYRHVLKIMLGGLFYSAIGFLACDRLLAAWVSRHGSPIDYAQLPVYSLPLMLFILTMLAMLFEPLQNALSRHFERQADSYALRRTGLNDAYRSAFRKLAKLNKDDPTPHWLDVVLFHSHPPIAQRLAMADAGREGDL